VLVLLVLWGEHVLWCWTEQARCLHLVPGSGCTAPLYQASVYRISIWPSALRRGVVRLCCCLASALLSGPDTPSGVEAGMDDQDALSRLT
jgi:hypothetical protein